MTNVLYLSYFPSPCIGWGQIELNDILHVPFANGPLVHLIYTVGSQQGFASPSSNSLQSVTVTACLQPLQSVHCDKNIEGRLHETLSLSLGCLYHKISDGHPLAPTVVKCSPQATPSCTDTASLW